MPNYILNRNYTHRSINGVVSFEKDKPSWVVPALEKEIIAIGGVREDGETPDFLEAEKVKELPPSGEVRKDELYAAFGLLIERNTSNDFTGAGVPTVKAVEKIVSFDTDRTEITELWAEYKQEVAAAAEA